MNCSIFRARKPENLNFYESGVFRTLHIALTSLLSLKWVIKHIIVLMFVILVISYYLNDLFWDF